MATLKNRLTLLEASLKATQAELFAVYFHDGHIEHFSGVECIGLALERWQEIERFEEPEGCKNNGCLCELLNGLLIDGNDTNQGGENMG